MTEAEIRELYDLIRGERFAYMLLDAAAAFEAECSTSLKLVQQARESYGKSHARTLRKDPDSLDAKANAKEIARLKNKQQKYRDVLEQFDQAVDKLQKEVARRPKPKPRTVAVAQLPPDVASEFEAADSIDARFEVIQRHYDVEKVGTGHTFRVASLYYLRDGQRDYFLSIAGTRANDVALQRAVSGEQLKSLTESKLLELGRKQKLLHLVQKADASKALSTTESTSRPDDEEKSLTEPDIERLHESDKILDMGAFTQLLDSAQRSGLVPGADQVARVRDREFRMGKYQEAFQVVEGLYGKFTAAATQREQRLRREEYDIASGKLKMSPKELQLKRARDNAETQAVGRARNRFMRVMEGLRVLMQQ